MFDPEAPARTGADFSAADGREAVARAHALLSGAARPATKT
jgi:hypothetical protein